MAQMGGEDGKTEVDDEVVWGDHRTLLERIWASVTEEACMKV